MDKSKPNIFSNKIDKPLHNCQKIYYTADSKLLKKMYSEKYPSSKIDRFEKLSIDDKINTLISLPKYLYNIDLLIMTDKDKMETKIIGKNSKHLITFDNKLIPIEEIVGIEIKK